MARLFAGQKPNEALAWIERGRALDRKSKFRSDAAYDIDKLHRDLLTKLGRQNEALEAAWADFREQPSKFTYVDLMKFVPKARRREWQEKALDVAKGGDLDSLLELFVETKEMERLVELVRDDRPSSRTGKPLRDRARSGEVGEAPSGRRRPALARAGDADRRGEEEQVL